jgi:ligand-binding sensor domain-containing protein/putative methionine-R-sulfoxide reductase with GAF domain
MKLTVRLFFLLLSLISNDALLAQSEKLLFDHLPNIKGLGKRSITSICQDNYGFIWFGTQDGLLRFDGYELRVFKNRLDDPNSLSDNNIRAIAKDKQGNLWIATQGGGLNKFDLVHEQFYRFINDPKTDQSISGNAVWSTIVDSKGSVWCGTWSNGLNSFDPIKNTWIRYGQGSSQDPVLAILESSSGLLWFGSNGLNSVDKGGKTKNYLPSDFALGGIRALLEDSNGTIWLATDLAGVVMFHPANSSFEKFDTGNKELAYHSLHKDTNGAMWMGGNAGLLVYDPASGKRVYSVHSDLDAFSLSNNAVRVITQDTQGTVWIGNEGGGINQLVEQKAFRTFRHDDNVKESVSHNLIRSLYDDSRGVVWVGTQGGGLNKLDRVDNAFSKVDKVGKSSLSSLEISTIFEDSKGIYWIGTWGEGINKIDFKNDKLEVIKYDTSNTNTPLDDRIQKVYEDKFGLYWIGTENGLSQFDPATGKWQPFVHNPSDSNSMIGNTIQGQAFIEQEDGTLWIGTWSGLNRLSPDRKTISRFTTKNKLSSDHVISLALDMTGNLWIGTFGGGLNQMELKTNRVTIYTDQEGLPNNTIFGIKEDGEHNLWLSTNNGLSKFNPKTQQFRNYDVSEGLQGNEFYWGAAHRNKDGSLMFGGVNGLTIFNPSEIKDNASPPPIVISDFQLFNKSVVIGQSSKLKENINETKLLKLGYDEAIFTVQFSALNFVNPDKNHYSYMLENFDKGWINTDKRSATYTNLDPGEYIFKVRGSNNDNVWNETGTELRIVITPPFWRTWWFYILATLVFISSVYAFIKRREKVIREEKNAMENSFSKSLGEAKESLLKQQQTAREEEEKNRDRNWLDQSLAKFGEILSVTRKDVAGLSSKILSELIKHLNLVGGAIYILSETEDSIKLSASYGFSNVKKTISIGEGLVGMCFEKGDFVVVDSVPETYSKIASGFGSSHPKSLYIIPLKTEETRIGVLELASFKEVSPLHVQFIQLLAERMSITISITNLAQKTSQLLEQSRLNTEDLKLREEELKQNLEELQAIQEDRDRKSKQLEQEVLSLKKREELLTSELARLKA